MKAKLLIGAVILSSVIWLACSKSKFTTSPQLVFKGMNGNIFEQNQVVNFDLEVTDKEGDLQDSIFVQRLSAVCPDQNFIQGYEVPANEQKSNLKAEVSITFVYGNPDGVHVQLPACPLKTDTTSFKFWIKDNAGHRSDTVQSPSIVLIK